MSVSLCGFVGGFDCVCDVFSVRVCFETGCADRPAKDEDLFTEDRVVNGWLSYT